MRGLLAILVVMLATPAVRAQIDPSGIEFVTIGAPGNAPYHRDDPQGLLTGRGSVDYAYRMGKYEVTTAQWLEFYNTFKARADMVPDSVLPPPVNGLWGAQVDPTYLGPGRRYRLIPDDPDAGIRFAGSINWRAAAMFCNWQCNGKSSALTAIQNGAYDASTFTSTGIPTNFNDQLHHNPGSQFWIPTLDEWAKASYFDPALNNGQGGWWLGAYGRDVLPIEGPPPSFGGNGQTNTFFQLPGELQRRIPLGAYASVGSVSRWGLLDSAGGTSEWLEERFTDNLGRRYRYLGGSSSVGGGVDWAFSYGADFPDVRDGGSGFRIASLVPSPSSVFVLASFSPWLFLRRRTQCGKKLLDARVWH